MDIGKYKKAMRPKKYLDGDFVVYDPSLPDPSDVQLETRDTFAIGGGVIEGNDLGTREGFYKSELVNHPKGKYRVQFSYNQDYGDPRFKGVQYGTKKEIEDLIKERSIIAKESYASGVDKAKQIQIDKKNKLIKDTIDSFIEKGDYENFKTKPYKSQLKTKLPSGQLRQSTGGRVNPKTYQYIRDMLDAGDFENLSKITGRSEEELIEFNKKLPEKGAVDIEKRSTAAKESWPEERKLTEKEKKETEKKIQAKRKDRLEKTTGKAKFIKGKGDFQFHHIKQIGGEVPLTESDLKVIDKYMNSRLAPYNKKLNDIADAISTNITASFDALNSQREGDSLKYLKRVDELNDQAEQLVKKATKELPKEFKPLIGFNKFYARTDEYGLPLDDVVRVERIGGGTKQGQFEKPLTQYSRKEVAELQNKINQEADKLKLEQKLQENPGLVEPIKNSGFKCRREVGGKVDLECLANDVFKEQEKLKTGTDLQKKSAANKFKNAAKNITKNVGKARAGTLAALGGPVGLAIEGGIEGLLIGWDMLINDKPFKEAWADNTIFLGGMFSSKSGEDMRQEIIVGDDPLAQEYYNAKQKLDQYDKLQKDYQNSIGTDFEEQQYIKFKNYEESIKDEIPELIQVLKPGTEQQQAYMKSELEFRKKRAGAKYDKALGMSEDDPLSEGDPYATEQAKQRELSEVEEEVRGQYGKTFEDFKKEVGPLIYDQISKYYGREIKPGMYVEYDKDVDDVLLKQYEKDLPFFKENINTEEQFPFYAAYAGGGRVGFKDGGSGMTRRGFLKVIGALASSIAAAKSGFVKFAGKEAAKEVVTTPNIAGKPEWFDAVVNKIIKEGADLTKQFATKERELVHVQKLGEQEGARVVRDLETGAIRLDYDSPTNMGQDTISFTYKPGYIQEDGTKVGPYFQASEAEPRGIRMGPDDYDIEFDGENVVDAVEDLNSDVSTLKQYGTGKLDEKDLKVRKIKNEKVAKINDDQTEQASYLENKYGMTADDANDYDLNYQDYSDYD